MDHYRGLLELAYYHGDLRTSANEEEAEERRQADAARRQRGERLVAACSGDWRKRRIIHWCRRCCDSHEESVEHVLTVLLSVAFQVPAVPAANKWLSVWPLVADVTMMFCFHSVFIDAVRHALGLSLIHI